MKDFTGHKTIKVKDLRLCVNKLLAKEYQENEKWELVLINEKNI